MHQTLDYTRPKKLNFVIFVDGLLRMKVPEIFFPPHGQLFLLFVLSCVAA